MEKYKTIKQNEIEMNISNSSKIITDNSKVNEFLLTENKKLKSENKELLEFVKSLLNESEDIVHSEIKKEAKSLMQQLTK